MYALSDERLAVLKPGGGWPEVAQESAALYEETRAAVEGYHH